MLADLEITVRELDHKGYEKQDHELDRAEEYFLNHLDYSSESSVYSETVTLSGLKVDVDVDNAIERLD